MKKYIFIIVIFLSGTFCWAQYWTGDGGRGIRVTVSEITGRGLSIQEEHILHFTQSTIIGVFNNFSAMTVFDRQNLESILREQRMSLAGNFSDTDLIRIGQLTNARLIVFGSITKSGNNYTLEFAVTDVETGNRRASYLPRQVSLLALENHSAIKEAAADLLRQLGVTLTSNALQELGKAEDTARIQYENVMARGIAATRQGTTVEALTYFFEAAAFNPSMMSEAMNRISTTSATIAGGNLGHAARSRQQEHDEWRTIVNAARTFYTNHLPYEFVYNAVNIRQVAGSHDFTKRTANYSIDISLIPKPDAWRTINDLRQGLANARRNDNWNFSLNQIGPSEIIIILDLFNENNVFLAATSTRFVTTFNSYQQTPGKMDRSFSFFDVNIDNITDQLNVHVRSVNEVPAQRAGETGFIQISTLQDYDRRMAPIWAREDAEEVKRKQEAEEAARIAAREEAKNRKYGFLIGYNYSTSNFHGVTCGYSGIYVSMVKHLDDFNFDIIIGYAFNLIGNRLRLPAGIGINIHEYEIQERGRISWETDINICLEARLQFIMMDYIYLQSTIRLIDFSRVAFTFGVGFVFKPGDIEIGGMKL